MHLQLKEKDGFGISKLHLFNCQRRVPYTSCPIPFLIPERNTFFEMAAFTPSLLHVWQAPRAHCALVSPIGSTRYATSRTVHMCLATPTRSTISSSSDTPQPPPSQLDNLSERDRSRIENVRDQLEFWFSASNLRRDWYLRRQMDGEGWLDPSVFLLFNRIKRLQASLDDVILAGRLSDELEVRLPSPQSFGDDAAQTRIRRSPTLPDFREWDDSELRRSFMLKSIPHDSTVDSLLDVFTPLGPVSYVHVYRAKAAGMSPRALVCFDEESVADKVFEVLGSSAPPGARGMIIRRRHLAPGSNGAEVVADMMSTGPQNIPGVLLILKVLDLPETVDWKSLFRELDDAVVLRSARHIRFLLYTPPSTECYLTLADVPAVRDMIEYFLENGLIIANEKVGVRLLEEQDELQQYWEMANAHQDQRRKRRAEKEAGGSTEQSGGAFVQKRPSSVVFKIQGFSEDMTWQTIKSDLMPLGKIVFLNYEKGLSECHVRVGSPAEAQMFCAELTADDGVKIGGQKVDAYVLEGEEETVYWERAEHRQKMRQVKLKDVASGGERRQPVAS